MSNKKWTKRKCLQQARKFSTRNQWAKNNSGSYRASSMNGWFEECCSHMRILRAPINSWSLERCRAEGIQYRTLKEWRDNSPGSYIAARRHPNRWMTVCSAHMNIRRPNGFWTKERCMADARRYNTRIEWARNSRSSYQVAFLKNWLVECCAHMISLQRPNGFWTKERCVEDARRYTTRTEWARNSSSAYTAARRAGWIITPTSNV